MLVAYGKMVLKEQLNCPEATEEFFPANMLVTSCPAQLQQQFGAELVAAPLRGEIIATRCHHAGHQRHSLNLRQPDEGRDRRPAAEAACAASPWPVRCFRSGTLWRDIDRLRTTW